MNGAGTRWRVRFMKGGRLRHGLFSTVVLLIATIVGCGPPPLSARYSVLRDLPSAIPASTTVIVFADDQIHHLYGDPFWLRSDFTRKLVKTAIRPVQLDMFGDELVRAMLEAHGDRFPFIHLGDAADIGCRDELIRFLRLMTQAKKGWVMAPGNHDVYFFGNYQPSVTPDVHDWERACARGGPILTKDRFIGYYLSVLATESEEGAREFGKFFLQAGKPANGNWVYPGSKPHFLDAVAWVIDAGNPHRSYIVQRVSLKGALKDPRANFIGILFDTTQFKMAPSLLPLPTNPNAGNTGSIQPDQFEVVRAWLDGAKSGGQRVVMMGHHPYNSLEDSSRAVINKFRIEYPIFAYVSAHTHRGRYYVQGTEGDTWTELNLGSILDWPPEYRGLSFQQSTANRALVMRTPLYRLNEQVEQFGVVCDPVWEPMPNSTDYALSYQTDSAGPGATQQKIFKSILATYKRLFSTVKTQSPESWPEGVADDNALIALIDAKSTAVGSNDDELANTALFLMELDEFERRRRVVDPKLRRNYRFCQAMWASTAFVHDSRTAEVDDWFISFPNK